MVPPLFEPSGHFPVADTYAGSVSYTHLAHLSQSFDQSGAATGIVNAHQVHFLKSKVSHIKSPFPHSFWALSFCVLP